MKVVSILLGRLADAGEIKRLLPLLDTIHGLLFSDFARLSSAMMLTSQKEVHACLAQLDASGVGAALVGREFSVVELEIDDNFPVLANGQLTGAFHAERRLVHCEASVVLFVVVVEHIDADVAHVRDGDLPPWIRRTGLQRSDRRTNGSLLGSPNRP